MTKKNIAIIVAPLLLTLVAAITIPAINKYKDHREETQKIEIYATLIPLIGLQDSDDFETKVDKVRAFLFEHTQFNVGSEFHKIWHNHTEITRRIKAHATGQTDKRAPLECSARSTVLESIYQSLGYNTHSISAYKHRPNYPSHTFSEVQNPNTGKWHVQDVQHNQFWRMKDTGERASIDDLIKNDESAYTPCRTKDLCVTWDTLSRENETPHKLEAYYDSASVIDRKNNRRPFIVNAKRFDLNTPVEIKGKGLMTYCKYRHKNCRDEIIIYNKK